MIGLDIVTFIVSITDSAVRIALWPEIDNIVARKLNWSPCKH